MKKNETMNSNNETMNNANEAMNETKGAETMNETKGAETMNETKGAETMNNANEAMNETTKAAEVTKADETKAADDAKKAARSAAAKKAAATRKKNAAKAKAEADAAKAKAAKAKNDEAARHADDLTKAGAADAKTRTAELADLVATKKADEAAKAKAAKPRAIDDAPKDIKTAYFHFREESEAAAKKADEGLSVFAESRSAVPKFGKGTRIDWFKAVRVAATRVIAYERNLVWPAIIDAAFAPEEVRIARELAAATTEHDDAKAAALVAEAAELAAKKAATKGEDRTFRFTKAENAAFAEYEKAADDAARRRALVKFMKAFAGLDLSGNAWIDGVVRKIGTERAARSRDAAKSGGTRGNRGVRGSEAIRIVFGALFESMYAAGTIKAVHVPQAVIDYYNL